MSTIYQPEEDSYLLQKHVKTHSKNKNILEIGSGSGIQILTALKSKAKSILATDINPEAIKHLKSKKIPTIKSNLFEKISKTKKFDLIIFNPPYLPRSPQEPLDSQLATTGGKKGDEITLKFLKQAPKHLNPQGKILLLISSLTPHDKILQLLKKQNLKHKILEKKKIFFETLECWEIY